MCVRRMQTFCAPNRGVCYLAHDVNKYLGAQEMSASRHTDLMPSAALVAAAADSSFFSTEHTRNQESDLYF
jgi:hypothetical protein